MKKLILVLVFCALGFSYLWAQKTFSGTVIGPDGLGLPGVSVVEKTSPQNGTYTDIDGKWTLTVPNENSILIFSSVGMKNVELKAGVAVKKFKMQQDSQLLGEVVVTGMGAATDKRKVAISVESVNENSLKQVPNKSIDGALIGRIAGAQIQSTSGQPGQQANIILRGINSLSGTQPMILIDGVEINSGGTSLGTGNISSRLADLDLSNVERVEVVQGAAAATIYGAQGANGVIQIFTKKGKVGRKTSVSYSGSLSIDNVLKGNLETAKYHFYSTTKDGFINDGTGTPIKVDPKTGYWTAPDETVTTETENNKPYKEKTYDHLDQYFKKNVITQSHSLNITGASKNIDYAIGASYMNQESPVNGVYEKKNLTTNIGTELFKDLKIRLSTQIIESDNNTGGINNRNNVFSGLSQALTTPKFVDLKFKDTKGNPFVMWNTTDNGVMPFYTFKNRENSANLKRIIQGINAHYKVNKYIELDYKYGIDHYRYNGIEFINNQKATATPGKGIEPHAGKLVKQRIQETAQNSLFKTFINLDFEKDLKLNIPLKSSTQFAYDWRKKEYSNVQGTGTGFGQDPPFTLRTAKTKTADEYIEEFITYGFLINQKFDYENLAGFSLGIRSDYSSAFGEGGSAFTFPRGDLYLRLSELLKKEVIYDLKLRAAYGEAGIQPNAYDRLVTAKSGNLGDQSYFYLPSTSRNTKLGVEKTKEMEIGLDYGLHFNDAMWLNNIKGSLVYWDRKSSSAIYNIDIAPSKGAQAIKTNAIDLSSNGIQFSLDMNIYTSDNLKWNFGTRFSTGKTIIDNIANHKPIVIGASGEGETVIKEGEAVGAFFGTKPLSSLDEKNSKNERYIPTNKIGDYEIVEGMVVNKKTKQVQFTSEKEKIGDATPDFTMSFFNDVQINKNLTFSFQLDWTQGAEAYNATRQWMYKDKIHGDLDKEITINGKTGSWITYYTSLYNTSSVNKYFVENASYLRMRNISLSYDFTELLNTKYIKGLTFTVSVKNVFTITDYSGLDPEAVGTQLNNPLYRGIDLYSNPNMRSINLGVNVKF